MQFDHAVFHWINSWPSSLESAMQFFSQAINMRWVQVLLLIVLIAMIAAGKDTRKGAICSMIAFPLSDGTTNLFKHWFPLPRPFDDPTVTGIMVRLPEAHTAGTASAHSANMMAAAICMLIALRWGGIPWLLLAFLVSLSRIYTGMHFPYQVLLGWIVGAFYAVLISWLWDFIAKKRAKKSEGDEPPAPKPQQA
ncbi:MAG: phosphatase PAP2 family protein [Armatimonadetes bacterium]|nr:phosphatase PAP2 family protein [Armatimonadota bacterium]MBS1728369.1 phosphatase PAP2 family protein [Armatimonadota bacterium]